jgi:hypothetical protein
MIDSGALVALPVASREPRRQWSAAMPRDLASVDYMQEFVALLTRNAPTRTDIRQAG